MKILVADDDKEIVELLSIYIHNEGYEVVKAYDGKKRYQIAHNTRYRFINLGHYDANHGWNGSSERTSKRIANSIIMLTAKQPIWIKSKA